MLNILGTKRKGYCDGVTRRDFLKIGGLALGGLSLPGLLRAEEQAGIRRSHKAVIMIFLAGGPPHQDMFDLKPEPPRASAANSGRSRRTCRGWKSASTCPAWRGSWINLW